MSRNSILAFIGSVALAASMWFYVRHVLVPMQKAYAVAHQRPRGNLSDLYPRWLGARELLLHGRDPYSPEITREIQIGYYGRPLDASRSDDPKDQEGFVYPVYVVFLLAPTIMLPFAVVQSIFYWLLLLIIVVMIILWFKVFRLRSSRLTIATAIALTLSSFPVIQSIALRQLSILVAGFLVVGFLLIVRQKFVFAGLVLAIATIKPQLVLPIALWLAVWVMSDWRQRKGLFLGFIGGMAALLVSAEWVLAGWLTKFYYAIIAYWHYTGGLTPSDVLFGPALGKVMNVLLVLIAGLVCLKARHKHESSVEFFFASCFVLATTVAIVPIFAPYNQLLLLPGFLFLFQHREALMPTRHWQKALLGIAMLMLCWQWITSIALTAIYCTLSEALVNRIWQVPFYSSVALPMVLMCLLYVCVKSTDPQVKTI